MVRHGDLPGVCEAITTVSAKFKVRCMYLVSTEAMHVDCSKMFSVWEGP